MDEGAKVWASAPDNVSPALGWIQCVGQGGGGNGAHSDGAGDAVSALEGSRERRRGRVHHCRCHRVGLVRGEGARGEGDLSGDNHAACGDRGDADIGSGHIGSSGNGRHDAGREGSHLGGVGGQRSVVHVEGVLELLHEGRR